MLDIHTKLESILFKEDATKGYPQDSKEAIFKRNLRKRMALSGKSSRGVGSHPKKVGLLANPTLGATTREIMSNQNRPSWVSVRDRFNDDGSIRNRAKDAEVRRAKRALKSGDVQRADKKSIEKSTARSSKPKNPFVRESVGFYISLAALLSEKQDPGPADGYSHSYTQSWGGKSPKPQTKSEKAALAKKQLDARLKKRAKEKTYPNDRPVPKGDTKSDSYRIHQVMAKSEKEKAHKGKRSISSFKTKKKPIVGSDEYFLGHGKKGKK